MTAETPPLTRLDLTGHRCPVPVIRLEAVLRRAPEGAQLLVIADDPIAQIDIPHFCREAGHSVERRPDDGANSVFHVTRGPNKP